MWFNAIIFFFNKNAYWYKECQSCIFNVKHTKRQQPNRMQNDANIFCILISRTEVRLIHSCDYNPEIS